MKIMFVTPGMKFGGAERVMSILTKEFANLGHDVFLHIMGENEVIAYDLDDKVNVSFSRPARFNSFKNIRMFLKELKEAVNNIEPDVIISFFNNTLAFSWWVSRKKKISLIFSERNDPNNNIAGFKAKFFQKIALNKSKHIVFQTKGAQNCYGDKIKNKSSVILNPFSAANLPPKFDGLRKKRVVSVGRLEPQKNQKMLIEAFANIVSKYPDYILDIYGEGSLRNALETQIENLNLKQRVFLRGNSNQVLGDINDAAVFAFSSNFEGLPNALIEAMSLGLPCVSTDCSPGGARELIENYKNGILIPCDNVGEMTKAIEYMLQNPEEAEEMGNNAKQVIVDLGTDVIANKWIEILKNN